MNGSFHDNESDYESISFILMNYPIDQFITENWFKFEVLQTLSEKNNTTCHK